MLPYLRPFFLLLLLSGFVGAAWAQAPAVLERYEAVEGMNRHLLVWEETPGALLSDVLAGRYDSAFRSMPDTARLGRRRTYWGKIVLEHRLDHDAEWLLMVGQNNYVDVFRPLPDGRFEQLKGGFFHPIAEKSLSESRDGEVSLFLQAHSRTPLYVRVRDVANYRVRFDLKIAPIQQWYDHVTDLHLWQGLFTGALLIMLCYNLLVYLLSRDITYLHYSLYIFFSALYYANRAGFTRAYLFPESVEIWQSVWVYAVALSPYFYVRFMRRYLDTPRTLPKWDRAFSWVGHVMLAGLAVQLFFFYAYFDLNAVVWISMAMAFVGYLCLLGCFIVILVKRRDPVAQYFLLGSFALWLGVFIGTFRLIFVYGGQSGDFLLYMQAGLLAELILFSIGLGYRMRVNEVEKRKAQEGLIAQLKENEEMQQRANRELEQKVRERTAALAMQKEEIEAQRDNLGKALGEIQAQNMVIAKKNQDITASINYAKRIQTAILPSEQRLAAALPQAFVLFLPRDIVSGDFYWHAHLGPVQVVAAVDCTGHGVPGAIMSMIGNDLLNEAVHLQGLRDPAAVLQYMHEHLQDRLQQEEGTSVKDGMDVALCFLDHERGVLRFAGARSPMVYVRQGALHELKGTRLSVGGKGDGPFQAEEVPLEAGMACYLFSDGYQDQFGGPEGRKFMKKRLLERMAEWHARPMREQGEAFRQELADWMGESQQIDDILLLGFRATA